MTRRATPRQRPDLPDGWRWDDHPNKMGEVCLSPPTGTTKWYIHPNRAVAEAQGRFATPQSDDLPFDFAIIQQIASSIPTTLDQNPSTGIVTLRPSGCAAQRFGLSRWPQCRARVLLLAACAGAAIPRDLVQDCARAFVQAQGTAWTSTPDAPLSQALALISRILTIHMSHGALTREPFYTQ